MLQLTYPEGGALVIGGTGRIGGGATRKLAEAGVPVWFSWNSNEDAARALAEEIRAAGGVATPIKVDLADEEAIRAAVEQCDRDSGRLHSVVYAAGPPVPFRPIADITVAEAQHWLDVDAMAVYKLFHYAIPLLRKGGGGSLCATTTIAFYRAIDFDGASSFSKAAVEALIKQIAAEEAPMNIRANSVPIGWIWPQSIDETKAVIAPPPADLKTDEDRFRSLLYTIMNGVRRGRPGTPEEAGNLFAFLASDQATYVTGQHIALDGAFGL